MLRDLMTGKGAREALANVSGQVPLLTVKMQLSFPKKCTDTPRTGRQSIPGHPKRDLNPRPTREQAQAKPTAPLHHHTPRESLGRSGEGQTWKEFVWQRDEWKLFLASKTADMSRMRRVVRRFSRPICMLLLCLSLALHLLLTFLSLAMLQMTCDTQPCTTAATTSTTNKTSRLVSAGGASASGPSKLQALFKHPLYNLPHPTPKEDDWLLRVKSKVKHETKDSSLEWISDSMEGYDETRWTENEDSHPPWLRFHLGISRWEMYSAKEPSLAALLEQLATHHIRSAVQKPGGTQLKLVMSFPNYGQALFKPMKQERDEETNPNLFYFSDFERHNAEIAAFHLDRVLGFRRIPPVSGRLINVTKEIKHITTDRKLARTFYTSPAGNVCFYGQCSYYCSTEHAVCGRPVFLEGSMAAMLPDLSLAPRRSWRSPWRRSYSRSKLAQWEKDPKFCDTVKKTTPYNKGTRLVDLTDMAILDFLMSNMDRHHYETFEKFGNDTFLLHLDNGRAFGRHSRDEPSILAPLQQCCRIRRSTLLRLRLLSLPQFRLSDIMRESLAQDPLTSVAPLLSEPHLSALDRRLTTVLQTVKQCRDRHPGLGEVIYDDIGTLTGINITAGL
ncbi:extracellular serine/threonine protein kinase FAM20C-like [Scleropages formosus]|uniref:Extracellular serine/threonine protein kinase FAM20C-like n=1 Tax=Scleropages formosus TaxID=113540 RepID=A0A0P7WF19_SCLFO|nr:extracellular serine/threonine protein kinase FAM20C-like [Scleropages formosus]